MADYWKFVVIKSLLKYCYFYLMCNFFSGIDRNAYLTVLVVWFTFRLRIRKWKCIDSLNFLFKFRAGFNKPRVLPFSGSYGYEEQSRCRPKFHVNCVGKYRLLYNCDFLFILVKLSSFLRQSPWKLLDCNKWL